MKDGMIRFTKTLQYLCLAGVIALGLMTIVATGGGGGDGGGGGGTEAVYPRFAYVVNSADESVSFYAVENDTGRLRYQGKVQSSGSPVSVTVDPSGSYAYVANANGPNVTQYTIGTDGALTPMTSPKVRTGDGPCSVTVDPSGSYAYVANVLSDTVSQYTIGTDGALTPMTPATVCAVE